MKFLFIFLLSISSAFAASEVDLKCTNGLNEMISVTLSEEEYKFLLTGDNMLENAEIRLMAHKRTKKISLVDKGAVANGDRAEKTIYSCIVL